MNVVNIHERELQAPPERVGALIDSLASPADALWPQHSWPRMEFDRPFGVAAQGGHGPIRYFVEEYTPGRSVKFRFTGPKGFNGFHGFECVATTGKAPVLRHTLKMTTHGAAILSWSLVFRPMHDALIEDCLAAAEASLGLSPRIAPWSPWVKFLRWTVSRGKARAQLVPDLRLRGNVARSQ